jgi:hypothetical protein
LKRGRPGHRFSDRYQTGHKTRTQAGLGIKLLRLFRIVLAVLAIAVGVVLVFIPGPAILFFAVAGGLLAAESLAVARFLDRTELWLRSGWNRLRHFWDKLQLLGKIAVSGIATCAAGGCTYLAYRLMTG